MSVIGIDAHNQNLTIQTEFKRTHTDDLQRMERMQAKPRGRIRSRISFVASSYCSTRERMEYSQQTGRNASGQPITIRNFQEIAGI